MILITFNIFLIYIVYKDILYFYIFLLMYYLLLAYPSSLPHHNAFIILRLLYISY